jgi:hypothetical protein
MSIAIQWPTNLPHQLRKNSTRGSAPFLTNAETLEVMLRSRLLDLNELKEIASDIRRDDERASEVIRRLRSQL